MIADFSVEILTTRASRILKRNANHSTAMSGELIKYCFARASTTRNTSFCVHGFVWFLLETATNLCNDEVLCFLCRLGFKYYIDIFGFQGFIGERFLDAHRQVKLHCISVFRLSRQETKQQDWAISRLGWLNGVFTSGFGLLLWIIWCIPFLLSGLLGGEWHRPLKFLGSFSLCRVLTIKIQDMTHKAYGYRTYGGAMLVRIRGMKVPQLIPSLSKIHKALLF